MKTARERVLDMVSLHGNLSTSAVAAVEAGLDRAEFLEQCADVWDSLVDEIREAEDVEAALSVGAPGERPL